MSPRDWRVRIEEKPQTIWETIENDLPPLIAPLQKLLDH